MRWVRERYGLYVASVHPYALSVLIQRYSRCKIPVSRICRGAII